MRPLIFACLALLTVLVDAQTVTVTDAAGDTIIQVVTLDPVAGLPTTQTIQTLTAAATALTTATATTATATTATATTPTATRPTPTTPPVQQGPVGQPDPTTVLPNGVTPYTYTTVIGGVTTAISDNFTPTVPATIAPTVGAVGTIPDYSSWLKENAPKTTTAISNAGVRVEVVTTERWGTLASVMVAMSGIWLVLP